MTHLFDPGSPLRPDRQSGARPATSGLASSGPAGARVRSPQPGRRPRPAPIASPPDRSGGEDAARTRLEKLLEKALDLVPSALAGDEEGIHDLRVSLKRVRVLCRELEAAAPESGLGELRAGATALFRALAGVRDLDIFRRELESLAGAGEIGGALDPGLVAWTSFERGRLRAGLPDAAAFFGEQVTRFRERSEAPLQPGTRNAARLDRRHRATALRRPARRFLKAFARARRDPSPERLHRLRIRGKGLRYTVEAQRREASSGEAGTAAVLESDLKKLQDDLGAVQDAAMVVGRLDGLGLAGTLPAPAVGPVRVAAARELERRRTAFLTDLDGGKYENLFQEVRKVAAKQGDGTGGELRGGDHVPLEQIPGIGPAKARRLAEAGLASPDALKSASLEELASVKTIGPHQARLIKEYVDTVGNGGPHAEGEGDVEGKRFERLQAVQALSATVSDYARTLAEELATQDEGDAVRAGRQAERLADLLSDISERAQDVSSKRLKFLRGELRETEGLLAKVLDLDASTLKMNKLRKALKAHRRAIAGCVG